MPIDLNSLYIFACVVEGNSFTEAARRLGMPVSTVSRRIADLETSLGVRLLQRSTRRLNVTDVGAEIFAHARVAADVTDAVRTLVSSHKANLSGTVRIAAPPSISDSVLAPLISAFQERHPDVRVQALITGRYVDLIAEGVDVAFIVGPLSDKTAAARQILRYRHLLVASPAYVARCGEPEHPDQLRDHAVLKFQYWDDALPWTFRHVKTKEVRRADVSPRVTMNEHAGLLAAVQAGEGITDLPPIVQPALIREKRLIEVMRAWHLPVFDLSATYLGTRNLPRVVRMFIDSSAEYIPPLFPNLPH
jgi:DNA-binding transcriptional LysR family regulator